MKNLTQSLIQLGYEHPDLRVNLRSVIAHCRLASAQMEVVKGNGRLQYMNDAFDIVERTYPAGQCKAKKPTDTLEYDTWWVFLDQGIPVAVNLFRTTPYGLKIGLSGHNGSPAGKSIAKDTIRTRFLQQGVYGEVSHLVEAIALKAGAPVIPNIYAELILGKSVELHEDGIHYTRNIKGVGVMTKVLVGKPNITLPKTGSAILDVEDDSDFADIDAHYSCLALS